MHLGDWIVLFAVALAVAAAVFFAVRRKKRGCSCGCAGCAYSAQCAKKREQE